MALTVRESGAADELQAAEVDRLATNDLRQVYWPTEAAFRRRAALDATLRKLVAVIENQDVVGVVQYRIEAHCLWLVGLGVHPTARRRGVASALLEYAQRIATDRGCTSMALHTVRETGNVAIFERLGFVVEAEGPVTFFASDRFSELSEVLMIRHLIPERD
jgi:GNAT superfamily N-acetyltransferase